MAREITHLMGIILSTNTSIYILSRYVLIFGNGLGMALDQKHFFLKNSLEAVWGELNQDDRESISKCVSNQLPEGENNLDILHRVVSACKVLQEVGEDLWLTETGKTFPIEVSKFLYRVAYHIYGDSNKVLPETFLTPLIKFIQNTNSHVATLNYDKLLYLPFCQNKILSELYCETKLVDGMLKGGFFESNLERKYGNDFGYYLHLHGSPLFFTDKNGITFKENHELSLTKVLDKEPFEPHIVLRHVEHKPEVIASSSVLSVYWKYLNRAIRESDGIILFGYSGEDTHLNEVIQLWQKPVIVIEWKGKVKLGTSREEYWKEKVGKIDHLHQIKSILEFTDWESLDSIIEKRTSIVINKDFSSDTQAA